MSTMNLYATDPKGIRARIHLGSSASQDAHQDRMDTHSEDLAFEHGPETAVELDGSRITFEDGYEVQYVLTVPPLDDEPQPLHTRLEAWNALSAKGNPTLSLPEILAAKTRPVWSDESYDQMGSAADGCMFNSTPVAIPLSRHGSEISRSGKMLRPHADVWVRQTLDNVVPTVSLNRWASVDGATDVVEGSPYSLTLYEATELARTLLLAVELATESDEAA